jgi:hypothetical protein
MKRGDLVGSIEVLPAMFECELETPKTVNLIGHSDESALIFEEQPHPFMSLNVNRFVNKKAPEYLGLRRFHYDLAAANQAILTDDDGFGQLRLEGDDYLTSVRPIERLHVNILYAKHIGQIVLREFCRNDGRVIDVRKVRNILKRTTKKINTQTAQVNTFIQQELLASRGLINSSSRRTAEYDDLEDDGIAMTNGVFGLSEEMGVFGNNSNVFGFKFSKKAKTYLRNERSRALDIVASVLGAKNIDRDIEDAILTGEFHVSLIERGKKTAITERTIVLPAPSGDRVLPASFVTSLDPKASLIIPNANKHTS